MFRLLWMLSARVRAFMRRYMPTNVLLDAIRTRRGLKWGIPAMGLGVFYLLAGRWCFSLLQGGAPEWLYMVMVLLGWNGLKFIAIGPVSVIALAKARISEAVARRQVPRTVGIEPQQARVQ